MRRSLERHTVLFEARSDVSDRMSADQDRPDPLSWVDAEGAVRSSSLSFDAILAPAPPVIGLLSRLKLGHSNPSGQDPLI